MTLAIGLTGGIGSGKSTAAHHFQRLGATVIDSDVLARTVTEPGTAAYEAIVKRYGQSILQRNTLLNREALRQCIFDIPAEKIWLESLLHPEIERLRQAAVVSCQTPYCLCVVPLLAEKKLEKQFDRVLVIDTLEAHQIARASKRDRQTDTAISQIIAQQAPRLSRLAIADDVIFNDRCLNHLEAQVATFHSFYASFG